jgi:adenylylsulfate kinase
MTELKSTNITWHPSKVTPDQRAAATRNRPCIVWLTGLSGCGKSTIAVALEHALISAGHPAYVLDGDNLRHGLNGDLGFSPADRAENIRRAGELARLFADAGIIVISSFISPYAADRQTIRDRMAQGEFIEVFVDAPVEICESRDPKGLYKKARAALAAGKPLGFTGVDAPYEVPIKPEIHLRTDQQTARQSVEIIFNYLRERGRLLDAGVTP